MMLESTAHLLGSVLTLLFLIVLILEAIRYFDTAALHRETAAVFGRRRSRYGETAAAFILSRGLILLTAFAFGVIVRGMSARMTVGYIDHWWFRWDAPHYIDLIENWYVTEGDARLLIVFLPMYPMLARGLFLLGIPARLAALLVSNVSLYFSGVLLYDLASESGKNRGRYALWLFMFSPVTMFFSMAYTESLFVLLTVLAVWLARKKRFLFAVIVGAMAANTRILGAAVAIPIFHEMLRADKAHRVLKRYVLCFLKVLPVLLGVAAYLVLNVHLFGDPFYFLKCQQENWSQRMGSIATTVRYTFINAMTYGKADYRFGLWLPQLVVMFASLLLIAFGRGRIRSGDAAYGLVAWYISVTPTWLLSGIRYIGGIYPIYLLAAAYMNERRFNLAMLINTFMLAVSTVVMLYVGVLL